MEKEGRKIINATMVDDSIYKSPEQVIEDLFNERDCHNKLFSGKEVECSLNLDGVLLTTGLEKNKVIDKYYNEVLESEETINPNLENTRFRNVKCAVLNFRSAIDHYDLSKRGIEEQNLFLKRIMVNMQRSYNMLIQPGIGVDLEFNNYLRQFSDVSKFVESEVASGKFIHDELSEEAVMFIGQVKNAPLGHEKDALENICVKRFEKSMTEEWIEDYKKTYEKENVRGRSR